MNNLSPETRSRFTNDIAFVADYLNEGNFEKRRGQEIAHLEALCDLMEALTGIPGLRNWPPIFWKISRREKTHEERKNLWGAK